MRCEGASVERQTALADLLHQRGTQREQFLRGLRGCEMGNAAVAPHCRPVERELEIGPVARNPFAHLQQRHHLVCGHPIHEQHGEMQFGRSRRSRGWRQLPKRLMLGDMPAQRLPRPEREKQPQRSGRVRRGIDRRVKHGLDLSEWGNSGLR
jgi:hypothetical protein